jgi:excisionase family DNA binding protein
MERLTLSVPEVARALGIGKDTAYQLVRDGRLPSVRIGSRTRVPVHELTTWLHDEAKGKR